MQHSTIDKIESTAKVERLEREMSAYKAHKSNPLQGDLLEQV